MEEKLKKQKKKKKKYYPIDLISLGSPPPSYAPGRRCDICNKRLSAYNKRTTCFHHAVDDAAAILAEAPPLSPIILLKKRPNDREHFTNRRNQRGKATEGDETEEAS